MLLTSTQEVHMKFDYRETANKIRQFGGKVHPRQKGSDAQKEALLRRKCDELHISPVMVGELN
jgi:hypothetical protein